MQVSRFHERQRPRVYLAGPDVFWHDSAQVFEALAACCDRLGLVALPPSDGGHAAGFKGSDEALAQRIYEGNIALIHEADGVIANLMDFRGQEPDSGTVFEVGYAVALGKPVMAYGVPPGTYADRIGAATECVRDAAGVLREVATGTMVEGLGQRLNLMLTRSTEMAASAEAALRRLAQRLGARPPWALRRFAPGDETALQRVFHSAVHGTAARDYTPAQIDAWAPQDVDAQAWAQRLRANRPFVVACGGEICGFADLQPNGDIDQFFVSADFGGLGVGQALMDGLHAEAGRLGLAEIRSDVSLTAEGFFARNGFAVAERRMPVRRGVALPNAHMRKPLGGAPALYNPAP